MRWTCRCALTLVALGILLGAAVFQQVLSRSWAEPAEFLIGLSQLTSSEPTPSPPESTPPPAPHEPSIPPQEPSTTALLQLPSPPEQGSSFQNISGKPAETTLPPQEPLAPERRSPLPLIFYALDSTGFRGSSELRAASRATWIQDVVAAGDEYRFFVLPWKGLMVRGGDRPAERFSGLPESDIAAGDVVVLSNQLWQNDRYSRERAFLSSMMRWALNHSTAPFVVKPDHDMFVCHYHLRNDLAQRPRDRFYMGYFFIHPKPETCRADQSLLIYSRDVVSLALDRFEDAHVTLQRGERDPLESEVVRTPGDGRGFQMRNWAMVWGRLARYLWARGELTVVDDPTRVDSVQGWHQMAAVNPCHLDGKKQQICRDYCDSHIAFHNILKKPNVMFDLWKWRGSNGTNVSAGIGEALPTSPPACFNKSWAADGSPCASNWMHC